METTKSLAVKINIGISSSGRWELLEECLNSIKCQDFDLQSVKVLLPLRRSEQQAFASRLADFPELKIEVFEVKSYQAVELRNRCIDLTSNGSLLYFLDEDCSLARDCHLKDLVAYHQAFPQVAVIGGRYKNSAMTSYLGKAYNLICDLWQDRSDLFSESAKLKHLLGGNLSIKVTRQTRRFYFDQNVSFGGEELAYVKRLQQGGIRVMLVNGLTVYHHASHDLQSFFARAWLHGSNKFYLEKESFGSVVKDRRLVIDKQAPLDKMAVASTYLGVMQLAYWNQSLQSEWKQKVNLKWTRNLIRHKKA